MASSMKLSTAMSTTFVLTLVLNFFVGYVNSLGLTDTITWGGDNSRTGYQTNHNMDPSIVGSAQFGQIFKAPLPGVYNGAAEQLYAQPLLYTGADGIQYLYVATTQNNVYKMDAKTGAIVMARNLHIPFLTADLSGCVDINPTVGITATGVIDPATDTWYLTAKTYANQNGGTGAQGRPAGRYYVHAINTNDLTERPNFPVDLEGTVARNNPIRSFNGGIHHQRPALLHTGQFIYAGFASHCVQYNFTGWIMGWDKTTGATVERMAMEGAGVPNTTPGAGVWMSGGGLTSDDAGSIFFATGNGYASQLSTVPVNGRNPPTSLEEAAVHMTIAADGSLTVVDFFMPWEKTQLDGADKDLGTTPLELLPSAFSCGEYKRIGVVTGKSGKTYWLNMDDLGGYQNGPNKLDRVIQTYQNENSVYAGAGVYPLEGGYIYINVIQYPTHVFKFSCSNGVPSFAKVADSPNKNAYILGVGHGTTTSLNGQVGTGLLWVSDVQGANLRIYNAVPQNGLLTMINSFNIPGVTKFTRPVFGDARAYIGTTQGFLYGFGSPVNLPVNCTGSFDFGSANLNTPSAPRTVTCKANVAVTVTSLVLNGDANFNITGQPTLPLAVAAGSSFTFSAFFNPKAVGPLSSDILVATTNGVAGYSTSTPVTLRGTGQSVNGLLSISPVTLAFQGTIVGANIGGVNDTVLFMNQGNSPLTISKINYSKAAESGPYGAETASSAGPQVGPFTFIDLPTTIPGNSVVSVSVNFNPTTNGNYAAYLQVVSDGGTKYLDVVGTAGSAPMAVVEFQTPDATGWVQYQAGQNFTFGNVTENTTRSLKMRVTNNATTNSASLSITVSKPPFGVAGIIGANNQVDIAEGTLLAPGENATATLYCSVPKTQVNTDPYVGSAVWTMNINDPAFGKQVIQFACGAISEQGPPLITFPGTYEGKPLQPQGQYRYVGCFKENNPGRQLKQQLYGDATNTNEMCIKTCAAGNYLFCGTQYNRECWGGPTIPTLQVDPINCNYPCSGNINEICGGNGEGAGAGGSYISLFADGNRYLNNGSVSVPSSTTTAPGSTSTTTTTPLPTGGPYVNPGTLGYVSLGCYTEATTGRALSNQKTVTSKTIASCLTACAGTVYAGMEYGGECWCGNTLAATSVSTLAKECSMTCSDNATEYCGAGQRLNMYQLSSSISTSSSSRSTTSSSSSSSTSLSSTSSLITTSSASTNSSSTATSPSTTSSSSSVTTSTSGTISFTTTSLNGTSTATSSTTISSSTVTSSSSTASSTDTSTATSSLTSSSTGSWTGSSTSTTSQSTTTTSTSSSVSPTRTAPAIDQTIGGTWAFQGCWTESTTGRALFVSTYASDTMTLDSCAAFCTGKQYFGVEYGRECYCGNSLAAGSVKATNQNDCNFLCPGNRLQYCGAGVRLQLYSVASASSSTSSTTSLASSSTSTSSTTSSSSVSGSSTSTTATSTSSQTSASSSTTSTLTSSTSSSSSPSSSSTSVSSTVTTSSSSGSITPSSSSSTSSTLSTLSTTTRTSTSSSSTSSTLSSSSSSTSTISSTSSTSSTNSASPTYTGPPVISQGNSNFTYYNCSTDGPGPRALPNLVEASDTMTIDRCLSNCWMYKYAGVEYARECWCGNTLSGSTNVTDTPKGGQCSFTCKGNSTQYCGAGNRLSLYYFDVSKAAKNAANRR
ncbi:fungistatic metabolite [Phlyctema vagabunda]|uniref:Fungistatic metabolite n=1 Tax=Phlyctema vagabunda TaxID=108571 RepID=A0ABR4PNN9_9HELO